MKSPGFNICPECLHANTCALTTQKSKVWSCSEFENIHLFQLANKQRQLGIK